MIDEIDVPESGWFVTALGAPVTALANAINALRKLQFKPSTRWYFNWEDGGAIIEYIPIGAATSSATVLWSPYAAPYTGSGDVPADWGLNIMVTPCTVYDGTQIWEPARLNLVITVPANCTTGYRVWLAASIASNGTLSALDYGSGLTWPAPVDTITDTTGTPPSTAYCPLFKVTSSATAVDLSSVNQIQDGPLLIAPVMVDQTAPNYERRMFFYGNASAIASP